MTGQPDGLASAIYEGRVRHRRFGPTRNAFSYRVYMCWLDLDELDRVFRGRWLWSTRGPNLAWFRRADHLGDPARPLDACVRDLVEERTGRRPDGPVRLLTHLRHAGCVMNPVSFYYCLDAGGRRVEAIVAEVHNTPWNERYCYVLDRRDQAAPRTPRTRGPLRFRFAKAFHVSPFMPMEQDYDWCFTEPGGTLAVHMSNLARARDGGDASELGPGRDPVFDATLVLRRRALTGPVLASVLVRYPLVTAKVIAAIYWQALRLRLKGTPFHPHPRRRAGAGGPPRPETA